VKDRLPRCRSGVCVAARLRRSGFNLSLRWLVDTCRSTIISAYSEINSSDRHRGFTCVLLNLWQATRTGFWDAQTSSASQRWDNRSFNLPSFSLAHTTHTHYQQKVAVAVHHLHLDSEYTPYPSFLPIPSGLAHWAILIGLTAARGKSRPRRPRWYDMVTLKVHTSGLKVYRFCYGTEWSERGSYGAMWSGFRLSK